MKRDMLVGYNSQGFTWRLSESFWKCMPTGQDNKGSSPTCNGCWDKRWLCKTGGDDVPWTWLCNCREVEHSNSIVAVLQIQHKCLWGNWCRCQSQAQLQHCGWGLKWIAWMWRQNYKLNCRGQFLNGENHGTTKAPHFFYLHSWWTQ